MGLCGVGDLTAPEVGASYSPTGMRLPLLLVFALAKALLVELHFMHLHFDSRINAGLLPISPLFVIVVLIALAG